MGSRSIPLRLTAETIERLDSVAARLGMSRSGVIKFCTKSFLDDFERRGVDILPGNWKEILHSYDGRVARHRTELTNAEFPSRKEARRARGFIREASEANPDVRIAADFAQDTPGTTLKRAAERKRKFKE